MYLGSAFPHKNLEKLVDAFDNLQLNHPSSSCFGRKEEINYESNKAKMHPSAQNIVYGFSARQTTKWRTNTCRCVRVPSLSEGFGLPALEAMVHGAPVASSDATCLPEVYGPAAHYFNAQNPRDIADKVPKCSMIKNCGKRLSKTVENSSKKYSWRHMAEETLVVYKSIIE